MSFLFEVTINDTILWNSNFIRNISNIWYYNFLIICEFFEPSDLEALAYAGQLLLSLTNTVYF